MQELCEYIELFCELFPDYEIYHNYSGRGMFGRTCIGICCDNPNQMLIDLTEYLAEGCDVDGVRAKLDTICTDDIGLGTIVYFPQLSKKA